jgi:hypothetical protein
METLMPLRLILITALLTTAAFARVDEPTPLCDATRMASSEPIETIVALQSSIMNSNCPNEGRMDRLCQYITTKSKDNTPNTLYTYNYQRIVYEAACVDFINDTDAEISQKVSLMWARHGANLRCGPMGVPATGSPLRFAIHNSFEEFITDALSVWKLNLNRIENNQTMLDFIDERISNTNGALKQQLERYRRHFVSAGAKKRSEL